LRANVFGPADIGRVVTLRTVTRAGPADLVGTLLGVSSSEIQLRRRDGQTVSVAPESVTHARLVPPAVAQTIDVAGLESVIADGWRALEVAHLGAWLLRASGGFTRRGNSVLPIGDPGRSLRAAVTAVEGWYADRGLPARVQLPLDGSAPPLAEELLARGWRAEMRVHVMTAELAPVLRAAAAASSAAVRVDDAPDDAWLAVYRSEAGPLPDIAPRALLVNHPAAGFVSISEGEECVAIARAAVDGRWAGLFAVEVAPTHRRAGLGREVSVAALRWALQRGARRGYLQVAHGNDPALGLYQRLGFDLHHDYEHYVRDEDAAASK
jgi:N-acetylglutamate synthase